VGTLHATTVVHRFLEEQPMPASAHRLAAVSLVALIAAAPALAQSPTDSVGWHFTAAAGYVQTSGNTELSSVNVGERLLFRPTRQWAFTQSASWIYGKSAGTESANQVIAGLRADYFLTDRLSLYALGGYERNRFAGITSRTEEAAGLAWGAVRSGRQRLDLEAGVGNNQQRSPGLPADNFWSSRAAAKYRFSFTDKAYIEEAAEILSDLKDTKDERVNSSTALVAPLTGAIALRFGFLVRFDNVPVPGFKKTDTTFTSGIQLTL
jgi:putative salt-induced outer membrane protein